MEQTRANAIRILNDSKLCSDVGDKVTLLSQLTELVVRTAPGLAHEFTQELVVLQLDQSSAVRKWLSCFVGEACASSPTPGVLALAVGALQTLVLDSAPGVAKQAVLSCAHLLRGVLGQLAMQPSSPELQGLMEAAQKVAAAAAAAGQRHSSEGVRLSSAKLREMMVLLFTADSAPPLPGHHPGSPPPKLPNAAALALEADGQLRALLDGLRQQAAAGPAGAAAGAGNGQGNGGRAGAGPASGPLIIVLVNALAHVGVQRPGLLGRVLPALMMLAKEGGYQTTGCEQAGAMRPGELSVGNTLRLALTSILKSRSDTSVPWRERIIESLGFIGAADAAETCLKYIQRQEYKEHKASKQQREAGGGGAADGADPGAKRQRTLGPANGAAAAAAAAGPGPGPGPAHNNNIGAAVGAPPGAAANGPSTPSGPPVTSPTDLAQGPGAPASAGTLPRRSA